VNQDTVLDITGFPVKLPIDIPLSEGSNLMGFPVFDSRNGLDVVQSLIDDGVLIKVLDDSDAEIYYDGSCWVNDIGDFIPGSAYYIKVNTDDSLILLG